MLPKSNQVHLWICLFLSVSPPYLIDPRIQGALFEAEDYAYFLLGSLYVLKVVPDQLSYGEFIFRVLHLSYPQALNTSGSTLLSK